MKVYALAEIEGDHDLPHGPAYFTLQEALKELHSRDGGPVPFYIVESEVNWKIIVQPEPKYEND